MLALASVCSSYVDPDINRVPALTLMARLAIATLAIVVNAAVWVGIAYLFAWAAAIVGRRLEGTGAVADVRAAIAWALVPQVWSIVFRIPAAIYLSRFAHATDPHAVIFEFIRQGGCSVAVVLITMQLLLYAAVIFDASYTVGEALHFSPLRGLATIAITAALPVIVVAAAVISSHT